MKLCKVKLERVPVLLGIPFADCLHLLFISENSLNRNEKKKGRTTTKNKLNKP